MTKQLSSQFIKKQTFKTINGESILGDGDIAIQGNDNPNEIYTSVIDTYVTIIPYKGSNHVLVSKGEVTQFAEDMNSENIESLVEKYSILKTELYKKYFGYSGEGIKTIQLIGLFNYDDKGRDGKIGCTVVIKEPGSTTNIEEWGNLRNNISNLSNAQLIMLNIKEDGSASDDVGTGVRIESFDATDLSDRFKALEKDVKSINTGEVDGSITLVDYNDKTHVLVADPMLEEVFNDFNTLNEEKLVKKYSIANTFMFKRKKAGLDGLKTIGYVGNRMYPNSKLHNNPALTDKNISPGVTFFNGSQRIACEKYSDLNNNSINYAELCYFEMYLNDDGSLGENKGTGMRFFRVFPELSSGTTAVEPTVMTVDNSKLKIRKGTAEEHASLSIEDDTIYLVKVE